MHIQKLERKSGVRWRAIVTRDGEKWTKVFEAHKAAKTWATNLENKLDRGKAVAVGRHTLAEAIDRYTREILPKRAASTQRTTLPRLQWWSEAFGTKRLGQITPPFLVEVRDALDTEDRSPATVNRYMAVLSHVLTVASRQWRWIGENPAKKVDRLQESKGRVRFLTRDEIDRLLEECLASRQAALYPIVLLALTTGMRRGEIVGLRWQDVDLGRRLVTLEKTKNRDRRGIPLTEQAVVALRETPRHIHTDLVFPGPRKRDQPIDVRVPFEKAVARAQIEDFRFHDLRHTAASYMAMNGVPLRDIAEVLGHRTLQMVHRYSHLSREHLRGVMDRLGDAVLGAGPSDRGTRGST